MMNLITRSAKGVPLEWADMDANLTSIQTAINNLISAGYITQSQAQSLFTSTAIVAALGFNPYNASNPSQFQTASQVAAAIQSVVGAAPAALDTLQEIAAQLQSDESAASALTTAVAGKAARDLSNLQALSTSTIASLKTQLGVASSSAGAITLISTQSLSSGSCAWTGLSGYNRYKLIIDGVTLSGVNGNGGFLQVQVGYGATPTYITSGYMNGDTTAGTASGGGSRTNDSGLLGGLTNQGVIYSAQDYTIFEMTGFLSTTNVQALFRSMGYGNANGPSILIGGGGIATSQATTALQIVGSNATITGGTASLYGISQ